MHTMPCLTCWFFSGIQRSQNEEWSSYSMTNSLHPAGRWAILQADHMGMITPEKSQPVCRQWRRMQNPPSREFPGCPMVSTLLSLVWVGQAETCLGPFAAGHALQYTWPWAKITKKLYETKNNHMHVQLGQILDKRYKKTKILNSNFWTARAKIGC